MNESYEYADTTESESAEWPGESGEAYGDYSEAGWGEARRRPPPVRTAPRPTTYRPSGGGGDYVRKAEFASFMARTNAALTTNSAAIKQVDSRVRGVIAEQGRQGAALRREIAERKKETESLRRDVQFTRELAAVIPLISAANPRIGQVLPLAFLLPSDFLGGTGTSGSSGGVLGGNNLVAIGVIAATLLRQ